MAGRFDEAVEPIERAIGLDPKNAVSPASLAMLRRRLRDHDGAREAAHQAIALDDRQPSARTVLAQLAMRDGDLDAAEAHARTVVDGPDRRGDPPGPIAGAWHLLGTVLERRERWDDAFAAHTRGNDLQRATPAARRALATRIDYHAAYAEPGFEERYAGWGAERFDDGIPDPVILTGFPRSGTTMAEQMLAAHPALATGEELPLCAPIHREVALFAQRGGHATPMDALDAMDRETIGRLRRMYRDGLESGIDPSLRDRILIDKHPSRVPDLGLVGRLFPGARVIVMIRDPRDACLSALFQHFMVDEVNARFLSPETTAGYYADVMRFWLTVRGSLPIEALEVRYEDLVGDFDAWARRMVELAGAPWDDRVRDFHEHASGRAIGTASSEAVTDRLNARSIGRWRRHAGDLGPMVERLAPFVEAFGYGPDDAS